MGEFDEMEDNIVDLGVDLDSVPEQHAVAPGEWKLRLITAKKTLSKKSNPMIQALIEIADDPDSKLINHIMMLPNETDNQRQQNQRLRNIADFYKAFSIPTTGPVNYDSYTGAEAWGILNEEEDETYGMQNRIKRFIIGR